MYLWASHINYVCLSLQIYKIEIMVVPTSKVYPNYQMINMCKTLSTQPGTQKTFTHKDCSYCCFIYFEQLAQDPVSSV